MPPRKFEIPQGPPPPSAKDDTFCFAPFEGIYNRENQQVPVALKGQLQAYIDQIRAQVIGEWDHHLSMGEKNAWAKGRVAAVRFAILPDGSYTAPRVTVSSGRATDDGHAVQAITVHSSFPPPPGNLQHPLPICARFGYNLQQEDMRSPLDPLAGPPTRR